MRQAQQPTVRPKGHRSMSRKALPALTSLVPGTGAGFDKSHIPTFLVAVQVSPGAEVVVQVLDNEIL